MFLFFVLFTLLIVSNTLQASPILLGDDSSSLNLHSNIELYVDDSRQLGIEQITSPEYARQFIPNTIPTMNFGYSDANWWFRFDLKIQSQETWYLVVDQPIGGEIELFILDQDAQLMPASQMLYESLKGYRTPAWKLNLPLNKTFTLYLRANNGRAVLRLPIKLMDSDTLINHGNKRYMFFMLVFVGLWLLAIFNFFLFFSFKESSYLRIIPMIIFLQFVLYRDSNIFPELVFLNNSYTWFHGVIVFMGMGSAFYYWRAINKNASKLLEQVLKSLQWATMISLPIILWIDSGTQYAYQIAMLLIPPLFILISFVALKGHLLTRYTYGVFLGIALSVEIYAPAHTGWFPYFPESGLYIAHAGCLLAIFLMSLNQAYLSRVLREKAERTAATNKAKDEFLTTMSHELRTPMHAVMGIGQLLKNTSPTPKQQAYLEKLDTTSHHMLSLIDDILDLVRLNKDRVLASELKAFRLESLIHDLEALFTVAAKKKGLNFYIQMPAKPYPPVLIADIKRLKQVLINLLGNAFKYTDHGEVSLRLVFEESKGEQTVRLRFEIRDTGIGISLTRQEHLFRPFYQVNSQRSRRADGVGLGLAISQRLLQNMGSTLELESIPDEGSCFFFTVSLNIADEDSLQAEDDKNLKVLPFSLQGVHILLVDDDELNRLVAKELLTSVQGAEVSLAESGQEAIQMIQKQTFDLVFMDVSMPDMNGYETTQQIRADKRFRDLPIVALTAHAIEGERERCLAAGMNDYLTKPFGVDELAHRIQQNLKRA